MITKLISQHSTESVKCFALVNVPNPASENSIMDALGKGSSSATFYNLRTLDVTKITDSEGKLTYQVSIVNAKLPTHKWNSIVAITVEVTPQTSLTIQQVGSSTYWDFSVPSKDSCGFKTLNFEYSAFIRVTQDGESVSVFADFSDHVSEVAKKKSEIENFKIHPQLKDKAVKKYTNNSGVSIENSKIELRKDSINAAKTLGPFTESFIRGDKVDKEKCGIVRKVSKHLKVKKNSLQILTFAKEYGYAIAEILPRSFTITAPNSLGPEPIRNTGFESLTSDLLTPIIESGCDKVYKYYDTYLFYNTRTYQLWYLFNEFDGSKLVPKCAKFGGVDDVTVIVPEYFDLCPILFFQSRIGGKGLPIETGDWYFMSPANLVGMTSTDTDFDWSNVVLGDIVTSVGYESALQYFYDVTSNSNPVIYKSSSFLKSCPQHLGILCSEYCEHEDIETYTKYFSSQLYLSFQTLIKCIYDFPDYNLVVKDCGIQGRYISDNNNPPRPDIFVPYSVLKGPNLRSIPTNSIVSEQVVIAKVNGRWTVGSMVGSNSVKYIDGVKDVQAGRGLILVKRSEPNGEDYWTILEALV